MSAEEDPPAKAADMLFVHSPSEEGDSFKVLRMREDRVEVGSGLFQRRVRTVSRDRIRTVDVTARAMHRLLGLARVDIGTGRSDRAGDGGGRGPRGHRPADGEAPSTDTPSTDTPSTDTPSIDTPSTETPTTETPTTDSGS